MNTSFELEDRKTGCRRRAAGSGVGWLLVAALAGCGGGGGDPSPPPATPLPAAVGVIGPARAETGSPARWQSSLGPLQAGWVLEWDFGDGVRSTEAEPAHAYARGGDYTVTLTVNNGSGERRQARSGVQVGAFARVQGLNCSGPGASGWCWQQPQPLARDLLDAVLVDGQTAVAAGPGSTVLATRNGGADWALQNAPVGPLPPAGSVDGEANRLDLVRFFDTRVGVAASSFPGRLLRTEDGGATWAATADPAMYWIKAAWLLDRQTIVLSGFARYDRFGYGLRFADRTVISSDGGRTWRPAAVVASHVTADHTLWSVPDFGLGPTQVSRDLGLTAVDAAPCCSPLTGLARPPRADDTDLLLLGVQTSVPEGVVPPLLLHRSVDAGRSWASVTVQPPFDDAGLRLAAVGFRSASEAWGTFRIDTSTTAGVRWQRARSTDGGRTWAAAGPPIETPGSSTGPLRVDATSWVVAGRSRSATWFADGETATRTLPLPEPGSLLRSVSGNGGLLLAGFGAPDRWYTSRDDGAHWTLVPGGQPGEGQAPITHLRFFDTQHGLAADNLGALLATFDGGRTWAPQARSGPQTLSGLHFTADATGWALADDGLWRSTDRGKSWLRLPTPQGVVQTVRALDARRVWVSLRTCADASDFSTCTSTLQATRDGGATWARLASPSQNVHFTSELDGVALSFGGVSFTRDGGLTWTPAVAGMPSHACEYKARFVDSQRGWILCSGPIGPRGGVASSVLRTVDGGRTWVAARELPSGANRLDDLAFGDANNGWLVGAGGLLLATRDGGDTWQVQASGTARALGTVAAVDAVTAWVGGERGALLATATGGR